MKAGGLLCAAPALLIAACAAHLQSENNPEPSSAADLAAAIEADAKSSDHESPAKVREALADEAQRYAQACLAHEPQNVACLYGYAVALGLQARAHPTRAGELLNTMLDALGRAETVDANYDEAGPARVRALVLIRAPGWPLGPGDVEAGVSAARRAVALRPLYPPNLLALAEALNKAADSSGAQESYTRARDAALALPVAADRDEWLREADRGLKRQ